MPASEHICLDKRGVHLIGKIEIARWEPSTFIYIYIYMMFNLYSCVHMEYKDWNEFKGFTCKPTFKYFS